MISLMAKHCNCNRSILKIYDTNANLNSIILLLWARPRVHRHIEEKRSIGSVSISLLSSLVCRTGFIVTVSA